MQNPRSIKMWGDTVRKHVCVWLDQQLTAQSLLCLGVSCITIQSAHVSTRGKTENVVVTECVIHNIIKR